MLQRNNQLRRARRLGVAGLALASLSVVGLPSAANASPPAIGTTIHWDRYLELAILDPQATNNIEDIPILSLVYEPLLRLNDNNQVKPWLASSYAQTNPTTYVFHLRPGVQFSNGRLLTASDVVITMTRLFNPAAHYQYAPLLGSLKSVKAINPETVQFVLNTPSSGFLRGLTQDSAAILPGKELKDGTYNPAKDMLGTGPWELVSHVPDVSWVFKRNPDYWRAGYPKATYVDIKYVPDESARLADLRDGGADVADFDETDAGKLLTTIPHVNVTEQENDEVYTLMLNGSATSPNPALQNIKVRQAINMALQPQQVIKEAFGGVGQVSTAAPPFLPNACPEDQTLHATGSKQKAEQLLKEAGYAHFKLNLYSLTQYPNLTSAAQVYQQELEAIGIRVKLIVEDLGVFDNQIGAGKTEATSLGLGLPVATAPFLKAWFDPTSGYFANNLAPNPAISAAINAANVASASHEGALVSKACQLIDQSSSMIPTATVDIAVGVRSDLITAHIRPLDFGTPYSDIAEFVPAPGQ